LKKVLTNFSLFPSFSRKNGQAKRKERIVKQSGKNVHNNNNNNSNNNNTRVGKMYFGVIEWEKVE